MKVVKSLSTNNAEVQKACGCSCAQHVGAAMQQPIQKAK